MHTHDIHGRSWQPCPACPHPTPGSCPSRRHRPYCTHLASDPATWGPIIAAQPPEDRPPRPGPATPLPFVPHRGQPGQIRLGLATPTLGYGGAERHMLDLASWLPSERYVITGVAAIEPVPLTGRMADLWTERGVPIGQGSEAFAALCAASDVVYLWGSPAMADRPPGDGYRTVLVVHGIGPWTVNAVTRAAQHDAVVLVAEQCRETLPAGQRDRAVLIHNAVDPERVRPSVPASEMRRRWGISPGTLVFGNLSRCSYEKGTAAWAPLAAAVRDAGLDAACVWVGEGAHLDSMRSDGAGLPVVLPGFDADVGSVLAAFDVFVAPSLEDAGPLAQIEAMLAGIPIATTPVGYACERPDLFAVMPSNAPTGEDILSAALDALASPRRAQAARRHALTYLTPPRFVREWDAILSGLAPRREAVEPAPAPTRRIVPRVPIAETSADLRAARDCPHLDPDRAGVGCGKIRCLEGGLPGTILDFGDHLACAARRRVAEPTQP